MEHLHVSEVELDVEAFLVERQLPRGSQALHLCIGLDQNPAVVGVHIPLQSFRYVSRIGNDDTFDGFIDLAEYIAVVRIDGGEVHREQTSMCIAHNGQFEPVVEAFSGMSPRGGVSHSAVALCIFRKAHGNVCRIRILHQILLPAVHTHQVGQDEQHPHCGAVYRFD